MNKDLKYLIENILAFNPKDLVGNNKKSMLHDDIVTDYLLNDTTDVLQHVFHMPVPDKWVVQQNDELNRNEIVFEFDHKENIPVAGKRVIKQLVTKYGFTRYDASDEPYAFINNAPITMKRISLPYAKTLEGQAKAAKIEKKLEDWKQEFKNFPYIVQQYFRKSVIYKTIWISQDQGVIMTLEEADKFSGPQFKTRLRLSVTGLVAYGENTEQENEANEKEYKDALNKMKFFNRYLRQLGTIVANKYCKFFICDDGEPYYISFFNMEDQIDYAQQFLHKKRIPGFLYDIINVCHIKILPELEKDDRNSLWEFNKQGIHIMVYDHIENKHKKYINAESTVDVFNKKQMKKPREADGCIIVKLDSYLLDMYNEKFSK